eukprot:TRINITY_DN1108_c0_g1_i1.p1 TRINITY_DN1108_c0_g1~~TRINITY_DN1108_c0_g1_i1.p1  ORF type:complete len:718 (+),score=352.30 TRINITY_DN1108_c0_g1_i1:42-2195(+)
MSLKINEDKYYLVSENNLKELLNIEKKEIEGEQKQLKEGKGVSWVTDIQSELPIPLSPQNFETYPPQTIIQNFQRIVSTLPNAPALKYKVSSEWKEISWSEYYSLCCSFAKALLSIGLQRFEGVCILGFNCCEWLISNMGTILAGGVAAGIYTTNGSETCRVIIENSNSRIVIVENQIQLMKFESISKQLALSQQLKAIVIWQATKQQIKEWSNLEWVKNSAIELYSWQQFLLIGNRSVELNHQLEERIAIQKPTNCCCLIYTSGTTGPPKGVMLSHDNLSWTARTAIPYLEVVTCDRIISYLPLSHIAAAILDIYTPLQVGATVYFAKPDALQGSLLDTMLEVRPTVFFAVPRVWEKFEAKVKATINSGSSTSKTLINWAQNIMLNTYNLNKDNFSSSNNNNNKVLEERKLPWGWKVATTFFKKTLHKAIGLDFTRILLTGAAPINQQTLMFFLTLDLPIYELFGMSECSGPHTISKSGFSKIGSCGPVLPGCEIKIIPETGELCMRGRNVFMGYLKNETSTKSTIDVEGWLHSGDQAKIDSDGYLYITGRIKELLITAGGENVAPIPIEEIIKQEIDAVSIAVVIGDRRKYLSCLLTLKSEPDELGLPTQKLSASAIQFAINAQSKATTIEEARICPNFLKEIALGIERTNKKAVSRAQLIRKWKILENEFSLKTGELTPTMKLKRFEVNRKYSKEIEEMYLEQQENEEIPISKL